jgi:DNA-binding NtrC family response regulator
MVKPVEENRMLSGIRRALELRELRRDYNSLKDSLIEHQPRRPEAFQHIITRNAIMRSLFQYAENVAPTPRPVLITGETGVGKELMAHAIHTLSSRTGPFIPVNISGVDDNLLSDTLFGHRKGAYTSAEDTRPGLIEEARHGTLFLDEIGDLSQASQIKILRLIQEGEYLPLGAANPQTTDTRIIAATNRNLEELQQHGRFRRDLYYRLQTHRIHIPPLRQRKEDIPLLINHFLEKTARALDRKAPAVPAQIIELLNTWHFPGNIRELEAMVFDALSHNTGPALSLTLFRSRIAPGHAHPHTVNAAAGNTDNPFHRCNPLPTLKEAASLLIEEALHRAGNNQRNAAALLGITPPSLNRRLKNMKDA